MPVANVPASKTKVICHVGDDICKNGDLILVQHLTYALNVTVAAQFAVAAAAA
jgi:cutinase